MNTRSSILLFSLVIAVISTASALDGRGSVVGSYKRIPDVNDPHVQELGKFAVSAHNERHGSKLEFVKIVQGASQVVAGTNYRLQISAKDGNASGDYLATVYERPWENYKKLTSFEALDN